MKMTLHLRNLVLLAIFTFALSFTSIGQITLTSPLGGESWLGGTDQNIAWTTIKVEPVLIELWDGSSYSTITTTLDGTSPYLWPISNSLLAGSNYKIRLTQDGDVSESGTFTITPQSINVTTPNTALIWNRGALYTIDWTDNVPGNVDIDLFDGTLYTPIAAN
ncbi:MAG: Ser-Thr-rich GPI-anchored membrane family protein, partial [Bacteroidales bacterium]